MKELFQDVLTVLVSFDDIITFYVESKIGHQKGNTKVGLLEHFPLPSFLHIPQQLTYSLIIEQGEHLPEKVSLTPGVPELDDVVDALILLLLLLQGSQRRHDIYTGI